MADEEKKPKKPRADKPKPDAEPEASPETGGEDGPVRIDPPLKPGKLDPWMSFLLTTTPSTKAALAETLKVPLLLEEPAQRLEGEEHLDFADYRDLLTPKTLEHVDALVQSAEELQPDATAGRFGLVETRGGEWGVMRLFKSLNGLASRIAALEGQDVVVHAFYGIPLPLTKGPQRYIFAPDGLTAMMIPMYVNGPVQVVEADLVSAIDRQEDGFVGPPALAEGRFPSWDQPRPRDFGSTVAKKPIDDDDIDHADDDDEDDEDDDADGAGHPKD